jgi:hypothetical protein
MSKNRTIVAIRAVLLAAILGGWALAGTAQAAAANISLAFSPTSIVANGTSQATGTVTVTDATSAPVPGDSVSLSMTGGAPVNLSPSATTPCTTDAAGQCAVTITSSTALGSDMITATDTTASLASSPQPLTLTAGPPATITVALNRSSIVANGSSTTTATATVTDAQGHPLPNETGVVFSSNSGNAVSATTNAGGGNYTATVTSTTAVGAAQITASDGSARGSTTLTQTAGPPASVTMTLNPLVIIANGTDTTTATAAVTDAQGHPLSGETVRFSSTDKG